MNQGEILNRIIDIKGLKKVWLVEKLDISRQTLDNWLKRDLIPIEGLKKLKGIGIDIRAIEQGDIVSVLEKEVPTQKLPQQIQEKAKEPKEFYKPNTSSGGIKQPPGEGIPAFDIHSAKSILMFNDILNETPIAYINVPGQERAQFAFQIWGHSMYKTYVNGDWLTARMVEDIADIEYGCAYLVVTKENRVVRRLHEASLPDKIMLVADNESKTESGRRKHPDYEIKRQDIKKLAIIVGTIKLNII